MADKLSDKYRIIKLQPCADLAEPVSKHADMLLGSLDGRLVVTRSYYEKNAALFSDCDPLITDEQHGKEYPADILLNFIDTKDAVIGYKNALTRLINKPVINVKQGYARCSTLICRDFAVSADKGILSALSSLGYDTLQISPGHIVLPGYDFGFIGGASFTDGGDVYFFGSLSYHPDGNKIKEFIISHKAKVYELADAPLLDLGGAVIIK
ncbi:MAG: hypothetical protein IJT49_03580 [Clostridia bacterium]|nr:hypothetical protein [Clostridia bacterium]